MVRALVGASARTGWRTRSCSAGRAGPARPPPPGSSRRWSTASRARPPSRAASATQCVAIREGQHLDVVEIDAASHGGVDDARELRERAPTAPAMGREKVYILDEAQRLSREAFDALLKLFEEPPPDVRFVLATTEPHKMPATIVGRCQRFDFRRITHRGAGRTCCSASRRGRACTLDPAGRRVDGAPGGGFRARRGVAARPGRGAGRRRDHRRDLVASLVGAVQGDVQYELADAVAVGDTRGVFEVVDRLVQNGQDLRHLTVAGARAFPRPASWCRPRRTSRRCWTSRPRPTQRLAAQAAKFTTAELSRVRVAAARGAGRHAVDHVAAALARAGAGARARSRRPTRPAGLAARIERLERLAGVAGAAVARRGRGGRAARRRAGPQPMRRDRPRRAAARRRTRVRAGSGQARSRPRAEPPVRRRTLPRRRGPVSLGVAGPGTRPMRPAEPSTSRIASAGRGRSCWSTCRQQRQMILTANLDSATAASCDGDTLEIAFPPGKKFGVEKVQGREAELQAAFVEVFGVSPRSCAWRARTCRRHGRRRRRRRGPDDRRGRPRPAQGRAGRRDRGRP